MGEDILWLSDGTCIVSHITLVKGPEFQIQDQEIFWEPWATENPLERQITKLNFRRNIDIKWNLERTLNMLMVLKEINQGITSMKKSKKCEIKMSIDEEKEE